MTLETSPIEPSEVADFNKPDFAFIPQGNHEYRQQGYYLICISCEVQHAIWIGPDRLMVGMSEDKQPILKTRAELGLS